MSTVRSPLRFTVLLAGLAMLGPFSIDAYLPAFPAIAESFQTTAMQVQQSLSVYLLSFGAMLLWYGALSDALGRKPVIVGAMVIFVLGSIGCYLSDSIGEFLFYRGMQGFASGAGVAIGRAMIRDIHSGPEAQRQMSYVTMLFALGPAIAPVIGGQLFRWFGWKSIFFFLVVYSGLILLACILVLPETLARDRRQSLRPMSLLGNYHRVLRRAEFQLLAGTIAMNFAALMLYVGAAPKLVLEHLQVGPESFAIFFVPVVSGIFLGSLLSGRFAGKVAPERMVAFGYALMFSAAFSNILYHSIWPAQLPWSILPLTLHTFGMSMAMPNITLKILDLFPMIRGLVSSLQSFTQVTLNGMVVGLLAPLLYHSPLFLALAHGVFVILGFSAWMAYLRGYRSTA